MKVNRERKKVLKEQTSLYLEYQTLDDLIQTLQGYRESYGGDARVAKRSYDYDDGEYWAIMQEVPETDKEMQARIAREEQWAAIEAKREREEFERLRAKFEPGS